MDRKITLDEYFRTEETNRPMELLYGYVREPPMPSFGHGTIRVRMMSLIESHVRGRDLGKVCIADVVLDREAALVVQPDIFFISTGRLRIVDERVWGAPDLVVEITSPVTEYRDRTLKLAWYRRYGVKECWLVYPRDGRIEVIDCAADSKTSYEGAARIRSNVLPDFDAPAQDCFN